MIKRAVYMLIIGKISEESLTYTTTIEICVLIGILTISSGHISMDVRMIIDASTVTAGKSSSTTLEITKLIPAINSADAKRYIALIITVKKISE